MSALHGIAAINGTHLTHNPHTGLPEAFNLGGFFKSLLPTIAGAIAAPLTGGSSLAAVLAGATTGAALNSGNPLMGAITGGLGGFGGAGIGSAINAGSTASTVAQGADTASKAATAAGNAVAATPNVTPAFGSAGETIGTTTSFGTPAEGITAAQQVAGQDAAARSLANSAMQAPAPTGLASLGTSAGRDAFVKSLGGTGPNADLIAAGKVGMPLAMAGLAGIEPPKMPGEDKYDPNFRLNLSGDSGLRYYAEGGDVNETPDPGSNPLEDAQEARSYGIGGLSYAKGGDVQSFAGGGYTIKDNNGNVIDSGKGMGLGALVNSVNNNQSLFADNKNLNLGGSGVNLGGGAGAYTPQQFEQMYNAYNQNQSPMAMASGIRFRQTGLSPEQAQFNKMMQQSQGGGSIFNNTFNRNVSELYSRNLSDEQKAFNQQLQDYNKARTDYYKEQSPLKGFGGIYYGALGMGASKPLDIWQGNTSMPSGSGSGPFAQSGKPLFAKGGFLDGPGDGMSDSIPATIGDKQPARLADGEFVVPADVVSHLGNGSTKAGAQRLYSMMDKVRHARTGTTKQGRQINPKKYLPA
jgi:hypothetical protein